MDKRNLKRLYLMKVKYGGIRKVKNKLNEIYGLNITEKEANEYVNKMNVPNSAYKNKNSIYTSLMLRIYRDFVNLPKGIEYINKKYGLSFTKQSLYVYASKYNVTRNVTTNTSKLTKKDELNIIRLYKNGYSTIQIAKMYNYKRKESIIRILHKYNIPMEKMCDKNKNNKTYKDFDLEIIDSKEKAYFIGFLATDGNINDKRNYINLNITDKDAIEFFSKYMNIKYKTIAPRKNTHKTKYDITLFGKEYVSACERIGLVARKTYTLGSLNLYEEEKEYIPYILKGIIDGDGWIRKDGKEFFLCSASEDFLKWCLDEMTLLGFKNLSIKHIKNKYNGIYIIRSSEQYNIKVLKNTIYKENIGLERKYKRLYEKNVQRL